MPFTAICTRTFCAAHALRMPDGTLEPLHGHNWEVRVAVTRPALDATGFVVDFHDLERAVDAVLSGLNNRNLNDIPELWQSNPTAEHVAWFIARKLGEQGGSAQGLRSVSVSEAPGCLAVFEP